MSALFEAYRRPTKVFDLRRRINWDNTMKSFCALHVGVLLLVAAELKAASVSESACQARNLSVTVDDHLTLYFDGVEITGLQNPDSWSRPDVVNLPCSTRLIAIHGNNGPEFGGILASTNDDYVLTNSTWKCSNVSQFGWEEIGFDDSTWVHAVEYWRNDESSYIYVPGISTKAFWIWLRQYQNSTNVQWDMDVYCRLGRSIDACDPNPCLNGGTCNNLGGDSFTCTCPIYATGVKCESPNYNEAYVCGTTLLWAQYNASNDFTRLCYFTAPLSDPVGRTTSCRDTINGIPLYDDANGLLNAGGNFGCLVSLDYPDDLPATSYISCNDDYQHGVTLGNYTESAHMMVCLRYPYDGLPGRK